jgi:hypothetical protein
MVTIVSPKENSFKKTLIGNKPQNDDNGKKERKEENVGARSLVPCTMTM